MCESYHSFDCWERQLPPVPAPLAHPSEYPFTPFLTLEQQYAPLIHTLEYPFVPISPLIDNSFPIDYQAFLQMPLQHSMNSFDNYPSSSHSLGGQPPLPIDHRTSHQQQIVKHFDYQTMDYPPMDNQSIHQHQPNFSQISLERASIIPDQRNQCNSNTCGILTPIGQTLSHSCSISQAVLQHFTTDLHMDNIVPPPHMTPQQLQQTSYSNLNLQQTIEQQTSVPMLGSSSQAYMTIENQQRLIDQDYDISNQNQHTSFDQSSAAQFTYPNQQFSQITQVSSIDAPKYTSKMTNPYFHSNNLLPYQIPKAHPNKSFDASQNQNNPLLNSFQVNNPASTNTYQQQTQLTPPSAPPLPSSQQQQTNQSHVSFNFLSNQPTNAPPPAPPPPIVNNLFTQQQSQQFTPNPFANFQTQQNQQQILPTNSLFQQQQQQQQQQQISPFGQNNFGQQGQNLFNSPSFPTPTIPIYHGTTNNYDQINDQQKYTQTYNFTPTQFNNPLEQMNLIKFGQNNTINTNNNNINQMPQYPYQNQFNQIASQSPENYPTSVTPGFANFPNFGQNFQNLSNQNLPNFPNQNFSNQNFPNQNLPNFPNQNLQNFGQFPQISSQNSNYPLATLNGALNSFTQHNQMFQNNYSPNNFNNMVSPNNFNNMASPNNFNNMGNNANNFEQLNLAKILQEYGNPGMQTSFPLLNNLLPSAHPYEKLHLAQALGNQLLFPINNNNIQNHNQNALMQPNFMHMPSLPLNNQLLPCAYPFEQKMMFMNQKFSPAMPHFAPNQSNLIAHSPDHLRSFPIGNHLLPMAHPFERLKLTHPIERLQLAHQIAHQFTNPIEPFKPLHNHLLPLAHTFERTPFTHSIDRLQLAHHIANNLTLPIPPITPVIPNSVLSHYIDRFINDEPFVDLPLPFNHLHVATPLANKLLPLAHPFINNGNMSRNHHHHHHPHIQHHQHHHPNCPNNVNNQHNHHHSHNHNHHNHHHHHPNCPNNHLNQLNPRLIPLAHPFPIKVNLNPFFPTNNHVRIQTDSLPSRLIPLAHPFMNPDSALIPSQILPARLLNPVNLLNPINRYPPLPPQASSTGPLHNRLIPFAHPFDTSFGTLQISSSKKFPILNQNNNNNNINNNLNNRLTFLALGNRVMNPIQQLLGGMHFPLNNKFLSNRAGPIPLNRSISNNNNMINNNNLVINRLMT